jgi:polyhydroxyalkanoate synthase subunit PhaC
MPRQFTPASTEALMDHIKDANEAMMKAWSVSAPEGNSTEFASAYRDFAAAIASKPADWATLQQQYYQKQLDLWMTFIGKQAGMGTGDAGTAEKGDRRFGAKEWSQYPFFDYVKQSYLLASKFLADAVEKVDLNAQSKDKLRFFTRQYIDAMSPSNFLTTNPEALKLALDTKGESLTTGLKNFLADMEKGRISMTDEAAFAVGKNIAVSEGAVVFRNDLIELIQYSPLTPQVYERPLLMVPPCINKFYIMDLEPENSFVRFAVEQGHTVFMLSWRNVKHDQQTLTWDDYLEKGVLKAIEVTSELCKAKKINVLGFCVGGTLLESALAVLAARKHDVAESVTLMTTLLEFTDVGDIGVYVDRQLVERRERELAKGGLVAGKELALAFSSLRANDLIWFYVVNNYLKGKQPDSFNLLYWNGDSTNLPGPMYAYYLRNFYHDNKLVQPDELTMCGEKIDLGKVKAQTYVLAAREDHIVPWATSFSGARKLGGKTEFVLGASGHIAGSMNPASKNKRNYWVGGDFAEGADHWLETAKSVDGSWWRHWAQWLAKHGGKKIAAHKKLGGAEHNPLEPAPGSYVLVRAED